METVEQLDSRATEETQEACHNKHLSEDDCVGRFALSRVPTEIMSHIFSFFSYDAEQVAASLDAPVGDQFIAIHLSHVSRHWRAVAHSTPSLWSAIFVLLQKRLKGSLTDEIVEPVASRVAHYLEHSRNSPLDIVIWSPQVPVCEGLHFDPEEDDKIGKRDSTQLLKVFQLLRSECRRWISFRVRMCSTQYDILNLNVSLPLIQALSLRVEPNHPPDGVYDCWEMDWKPILTTRLIPMAPRLRTLELLGFEMDLWKGGMTRILSLLQSSPDFSYLSVGRTTLPIAIPAIGSVPAGAAIELSDIQFFDEEYDPYTCSAHTLKMHSPALDDTINGSVSELFWHLSFDENLKVLELACEQNLPYSFPLSTFERALERSPSTRITNLALHSFNICDTKLIQLLARIPSLTHFTFEEYCLTARRPFLKPGTLLSPTFFEAMTLARRSFKEAHLEELDGSHGSGPLLPNTPGPLLPHLTHLALVFRTAAISPNVVGMIQSRRPLALITSSIADLECVFIRLDVPSANEEVQQRLLKLGESDHGLELNVQTFEKHAQMGTFW